METNQLIQLLGQMTIEEKIGQLQQLNGDFYTAEGSTITGPILESTGFDDVAVSNAGSILGVTGAKTISDLQRTHLEKNRLGIPLLFMADVIHGYRTIFPISLGLATSWNPELAKATAQAAAKEGAVSGLHVTFAPMVDLVRDPRWGRVMESTGEDTYLNGVFAKAFTEGFQGNDLKNDVSRLAACVKHFAAYGEAEAGRDYNTVDLSERALRENHLPAYRAAIEAGCKLVMTAFNTVHGIPASANEALLRQRLREDMDFNGVVISDWGAVREAIPHGVAEDEREAAYRSMRAGVDIEMMTFCYHRHVKELIESEELPIDLLDEAVLRILELKNDLGLFENPYRGASETGEAEHIFSNRHRELARDAAEQSIVLLKNDNVLPLQEEEKIAVIGPFADSNDLLGAWHWHGRREETATFKDVLMNRSNVTFAPIEDVQHVTEEEMRSARKMADAADKIVLMLGESSDMTGEACSRSSIHIPLAQLQLVREMKATGKRMIIVLFNGRPLDLTEISETTDALIEAWYPGTMGAEALARILYGVVNPRAKLTMTFPRTLGQVPIYYNHYNTGRPLDPEHPQAEYVSKYLDCPNTPLYPFGFGLNYTEYNYTGLKLLPSDLTVTGEVVAEVTVTNVGDREGTEIVQWYVQDMVGDVVRPLKELKAFEEVQLLPGQAKVVSFRLPVKELAYYHADLTKRVDPGQFKLYVGNDSTTENCQSFRIERT